MVRQPNDFLVEEIDPPCWDKICIVEASKLEQKIAWIKLARRNGKIFLWFKEPKNFVERQVKKPSLASCPLSDRERQVVELVSLGCSNIEIGNRLGLCDLTVKSHLARIRRRLSLQTESGRSTRTLIVVVCFRNGWID